MQTDWICVLSDDSVRIDDIYHYLEPLSDEYPDFFHWYWEKVVPGLASHERIIRCVYHGQEIAGILILKNTTTEKKICTLRVSPGYQGQGIGKQLLNVALLSLHYMKPLVTVPEIHYEAFKGLFQKNGFELYKVYKNYYREGSVEYAYNGFLSKTFGNHRQIAK